MIDNSDDRIWPDLPYGNWKETCTTLHLWTQVVGKVRLNHPMAQSFLARHALFDRAGSDDVPHSIRRPHL